MNKKRSAEIFLICLQFYTKNTLINNYQGVFIIFRYTE